MELEGKIVGGGGYGIAIESTDKKFVAKLIYDTQKCNELQMEAKIQKQARKILLKNNISVKVPEITDVFTKVSKYKNKEYLCGIVMERIFPPDEFEEQVHIALGYKGSDINNVWYVGDSDVYRGFYCNAEMIEAFGANVDDVAYNMGRALRTLIKNGVIPNDVEFILDKNLDVWMIDFGLAEMGNVEPIEYLNKEGWQGLKNDVYVPHEGMPGYESFQAGFLA
jgi:hypothetical protein